MQHPSTAVPDEPIDFQQVLRDFKARLDAIEQRPIPQRYCPDCVHPSLIVDEEAHAKWHEALDK